MLLYYFERKIIYHAFLTGHMVPKIIVDMRLKLEELNGKSTEGIFRLAGDVMDVQLLKDSANVNNSINGINVNDVHAYASLLKVIFDQNPLH